MQVLHLALCPEPNLWLLVVHELLPNQTLTWGIYQDVWRLRLVLRTCRTAWLLQQIRAGSVTKWCKNPRQSLIWACRPGFCSDLKTHSTRLCSRVPIVYDHLPTVEKVGSSFKYDIKISRSSDLKTSPNFARKVPRGGSWCPLQVVDFLGSQNARNGPESLRIPCHIARAVKRRPLETLKALLQVVLAVDCPKAPVRCTVFRLHWRKYICNRGASDLLEID